MRSRIREISRARTPKIEECRKKETKDAMQFVLGDEMSVCDYKREQKIVWMLKDRTHAEIDIIVRLRVRVGWEIN